MPKNVSLVLMAVCFVVTILFAGSASPVRAASDTIQTYSDPDLSIPATVFADGMPVYFTASDGATAGGTKTATVSNGTETVSMTVYDDGTHPDQAADDGLYTGHFRVSTIMTIDVPSRPNQPKIMDCIYLEESQNATITVDLDGGGDSGTKQVQLVTLFEVDAVAVRDDSATIVWTTSIPATSWVEYGLDASYGNLSNVDTTHRLHHRILLEGLTPGATYHYRVLSQDVYSDTHVSADQVFVTRTTTELEALIQAARTSGDLPQTYYVEPDGNNDDDGLTPETAWREIAYAVQQADVGDTIYVLPGAYTDEHVEFERSGIDVAPIRLLAHSSQPVLDGVDSTGIAIQMRDKSFIEIAGLRIVNYGTGIRGRGLVQHLYIHDFEMENLDEDGLDFDSGTSVQNCRFTDFGMNEISLDSGTAVTHFDYSSTDTYNVEIANFTITNAHGEAINWRNSRRVHIHHGTITNSGGDALHYQLNVHCSVASDLHVENTGWHGIAIHDHTVGDHPCYNNLIRNCYVYGAQHNDVDLHSGAFNTIVEDCHLDGPPATGQGLYFHNLGAGLIARKNTIHDTGDGIDGGPSDGEFLTDIIVEDNTLYNCSGIMWQGATENVIIRGNVLYDTTYSTPIHAYRNNILIEKNDIEDGKTYRISAGDGRIIDALDELYHARTAYGADVSVGYTDGRVFERELVYHSGPYTLTEPLWYPDGSRFQMTSTTGENGITVKVTPYPMTAVPAADEATVTVSQFDTSLPVGKVLVDFTADSTDEITVTFTISDLTPYEDYAVNRDGSLLAMPTASDAGSIQFSNSDWYTACTFTITQATTKPTVTFHSPTGIFVPLPPTFSITFSEPMSRTATEGAIFISGGMSPTGFAWSDGDRTVNFSSSASLIYATTYTVTVSTAAADLEDEHLPVPYSWQFTTQPEVLWQVYLPLVTKGFHNPIWQQDGDRLLAHSSPQVIVWDTMKEYTDKWPFNQALDDRANWQQAPYGVTDYDFVGDAMIESDHLYLFLFSNDEDSPCLAAKLADDRVWTNEIYKVHDTGYRNFGMGNMWVKIVKNTPEEVIVESAEKGLRFGPPPVPITTFYRITAGKPWLEVKPSANVNQQGQHDKRRLAGFLFEDISQDVILDAKKHDQFEENVYPEQGCRGILIFHRAYNPASVDYDFMWFMTYPPGAEQNQLTYAGIHYPDPYWEWDCKPCAPSVGATYVYLEEKVIIGALNSQDNWKREDIGQPISAGETYTSAFTAPYAGKWRVAAAFSDDDWYVTEYLSEVIVNAGDHFTFTSPRGGTLDYLVIYMYDRTGSTPAEVTTPMDVYRETIAAPQVVSAAPTGIFVPLTPTLSITFSEPMSRTVTEGAISMSGGVTLTGFAWNDSGSTVNFAPSTPLTYVTIYTVTVNTAATDLESEHLPMPFSWSFTTRPEVMWQIYLPLVMKSFH